MANKIIIGSRLPQGKAMSKVKRYIREVFNIPPSRTNESPICASKELRFDTKGESLAVSFAVDLLHPNIHRKSHINEDFFRKKTVTRLMLVFENPDKVSIKDSDEDESEYVFIDDELSALKKIREVFSQSIRSTYYGFKTEAAICTALDLCSKNHHTFEGVTFREVFLSSEHQDLIEKIDCQLIYVDDQKRGVFNFSIKSSAHRMELSINDYPGVYHLGIAHSEVSYLAIGSAVAKMIKAKDSGYMLHIFINDMNKLMVQAEKSKGM